MTAADRLALTGEHLLWLGRALRRLPRAPGGQDPFASLFQDPAAMLSNLVENILRRGPDVPPDDRRFDADVDGGPDGGAPAAQWAVASPSVAGPAVRAVAAVPVAPEARPPDRRHVEQAVEAGDRRRTALGHPARPTDVPIESTSMPSSRRLPISPRSALPNASVGTATNAGPRAAVLLPRGRATGGTPAGAGARSTAPQPPARGRPAPGGPPALVLPEPPGYSASGTATAHGPGADRAGPPADGRAPLDPEVSAPAGGARLAQGMPELAAALRTNLGRPSPPPAVRPGSLHLTAVPTAPPPPTGASAWPVPRPTPFDSPGETEPVASPVGLARDGGATQGPDIHELMERFTAELADEFVRVYGTSGR